MLFQDSASLKKALHQAIHIKNDVVQVSDPFRFREKLLDQLVYNAVLHESEELRQFLHWLIREAAADRGVYPASIQALYQIMASGLPLNFTVPALEIQALPYEAARACFRALKEAASGACLFQLSGPEPIPLEYATCVLAAALREGYRGPVFLQGEFFQVNPTCYNVDPADEIDRQKEYIQNALTAGFFNLDLDATRLVDPSATTPSKQQRISNELYGELIPFIREQEPPNISTCIGGVANIASLSENPVDALNAFAGEWITELMTPGARVKGLTKILLRPDWRNSEVLTSLGVMAGAAHDRYRLCLAVQLAWATLPADSWERFPLHRIDEVQFGVGGNDMIFNHAAFPDDLKATIHHWIENDLAVEREPGQSDEIYFRQNRRRALIPFKRQLWDLPLERRQRIGADIQVQVARCLEKFNVRASADWVRDTVQFHKTSLALGGNLDAETRLDKIMEQLAKASAVSHKSGRRRRR